MPGKHSEEAGWGRARKQLGKAVGDARKSGKTFSKGKAVKQVKKDYKDTTGKDPK